MPIIKKLAFSPIYIILLLFLLAQLSPLLKSADLIFSLDLQVLMQLLTISTLIVLSSLAFVLFAVFALDWKFVAPVGILACLTPFLFIASPASLFFSIGLLTSQILTFVILQNSLKNYLTFNPNNLFGPPIRNLTTLLAVTVCAVYFIFINTQISQKGFQIPDSLLDTALNLTSQSQETDKSEKPVPQDLTREVTKQLVKEQVEKFIRPYLGIIAPALSILLFLTLQALISILNLLIYPILWALLYIFEKTGFISYTTEQRPVKKMLI